MPRHATRRGPVCAAPAQNGLLTNLAGFWPLNEESGNALDLHSGGLTLTDVNTVTSSPGKVHALARQFTTANLEYLTRPGDDAALSTGDIDFTLAAWVFLDTLAANQPICLKWAVAGQREYAMDFVTATGRFRFGVSNDGTTQVWLTADSFGAPAAGEWHLVVGWHDSLADTINVQVNAGAVDSLAHAAGVRDGTDPFRVGRLAATYLGGRVGPVMFWKSDAGLGGILTAQQRRVLYNHGLGLPYTRFTL